MPTLTAQDSSSKSPSGFTLFPILEVKRRLQRFSDSSIRMNAHSLSKVCIEAVFTMLLLRSSTSSHSQRSAESGLIREALLAGMYPATSAAEDRRKTAPAILSGSVPFSP
jgi:hypothetical protein